MAQPSKEGHRTFQFLDMSRFTVNDRKQVCLDGHPIETQKVRLTKWQAFFATAAAIGAALGGLSAFAEWILSLSR